jgi:hypothetical protein
MTEPEREKWERVRAKGHARFILRSFWLWGVPMCAIQFFGPYFYDALTHNPYQSPYQIFPSPVWSIIFDFAFWIFGFGFLIGEVTWQKREKDYLGKR